MCTNFIYRAYWEWGMLCAMCVCVFMTRNLCIQYKNVLWKSIIRFLLLCAPAFVRTERLTESSMIFRWQRWRRVKAIAAPLLPCREMATVVVWLLGQNGTLWIGNTSHLDSSCHKWWNLCRTNWMLFFEYISLRSLSSSLYKLNESDYYNPRIPFHVIICSTRNYYAFSVPIPSLAHCRSLALIYPIIA